MNTTTFAAKNQILMMTADDLQNAFKEMLSNFLNEQQSKEVATENNKEKLLTTKEVKGIFQCGQTALYMWAKRGYLIPVKIGMKNYYKQSDIQKLIETRNE